MSSRLKKWGVAIVIVIVVGLVIQRSRSVAGQEVARHMSEAGVQYVLHVLNSGACTPEEVARHALVQVVPNELTGGSLGMFTATVDQIAPANPTKLRVLVRGRDGNVLGACQKMAAEVESFSGALGTKYRVVSWGPQQSAWCGGLWGTPQPAVCASRTGH